LLPELHFCHHLVAGSHLGHHLVMYFHGLSFVLELFHDG
jgi:hypothetical protein